MGNMIMRTDLICRSAGSCRDCKQSPMTARFRAQAESRLDETRAGKPSSRGEPTSSGGAGSFSASPTANPAGRRRRTSAETQVGLGKGADGDGGSRRRGDRRLGLGPGPDRWLGAARWHRPPIRPSRRAWPVWRRSPQTAPRFRPPTLLPRCARRSTPGTGSTRCPTSGAAGTTGSSRAAATTAPAPSATCCTRRGCSSPRWPPVRWLRSWGVPGAGQWITVYANKSHAYAVIAGLRWDTSAVGEALNQGSGPRWRATQRSSVGYTAKYLARLLEG